MDSLGYLCPCCSCVMFFWIPLFTFHEELPETTFHRGTFSSHPAGQSFATFSRSFATIQLSGTMCLFWSLVKVRNPHTAF